MINLPDPFWKLRSCKETPEDEMCSCKGEEPIILIACNWENNPIKCIRCNLEVEPSHIGFDEKCAEQIAFWRNLYSSIDYLWLDSREYESWAREELSNPDSPLMQRSLKVRAQLDKYRKCYLWWFQDIRMDEFRVLKVCPLCKTPLTKPLRLFADNCTCESCQIMMQGSFE